VKSNGEWLDGLLTKAVRNGEIPYQANRKAVADFDIKSDPEEGKQNLIVMLEGLDIFISDLEELENATETVAKQAQAAAR
jgi:hypothetical protein